MLIPVPCLGLFSLSLATGIPFLTLLEGISKRNKFHKTSFAPCTAPSKEKVRIRVSNVANPCEPVIAICPLRPRQPRRARL
jgi:hypothetical protein